MKSSSQSAPHFLVQPPPEKWRPVLERGMEDGVIDDVSGWQRVLVHRAYPLDVDGKFGPTTEKRTIQFQLDRGLRGDGAVGPATRAAIAAAILPRPPPSDLVPDTSWPFLQSVNFRWANRQSIRLIVIHTMENAEKPDSAEAVAAWFAGHRGAPPKASAHFCVDSDSGVRCVRPEHIAFAAPGANGDGYQIEHAGRARQTAADWADDYSSRMLMISARHAARIAHRYGIPLVKLDVEQVRGGARGFCGHYEVTMAFRKSTHVDPGKDFPWTRYLELVSDVEV